MKRLILAMSSIAIVALAVIGSQRDDPAAKPAPSIRVPAAFGPIHPRISPDGNSIVFSYQGSIWKMPRTGGTMTRLTDGEGFDVEPVWSPDGNRIAYFNSPNIYGGDVRLMRADGQSIALPKPVTVRGTILNHKLEFHPDGNRILGVFRSEGKDHGLAWYDLANGEVTSIVSPPAWSRFALSQDGKWIAYTATMDVSGQQGGNDGPQADIWKIPADGGKADKIVRFPSRIHDLCWTPDGKSLFIITELGGAHNDVWKLPLNDPLHGMTKLTFGQADEDRPSISRDGRWLLYTDNRGSATCLMVRNLASGLDREVTVDRMDFHRPVGTLRLGARDADGKTPITARVSLKQDKGKYYASPGSLYRVLRNYCHFYCDRDVELELPAGKYQLRVFRGPEYQVAYREIDIEAGKNHDLAVALERWTHQAKAGWFSGENHIHANYGYGQWYNTPATMLQQCAGEDLNICNFMVANSDTEGIFDRAFFRGRPDPLSTPQTILYWNQEFRSTLWGHMTLVNLRQVVEPIMTGFKDTTNPWDIPTNADIADRTHWQKGHVNYTHPAQNADDPFQNPYAAKGMPVDIALGKIDSLDLNASYAGTVPIWHRFLNLGFRLPASAGTDCFLNKIVSQLPGGDRAYVKIDGPLTYDAWIAGLRAGKTFVTNGPMLDFALDKARIGDEIKVAEPRKVTVRASARAAFPLAKVEVLYNGKSIVSMSPDSKAASIKQEIVLDKSGWLALRAQGPGHPDSPLPALYAHTSPIYVTVAGQPPRSRADALFFLAWIDRLSLAQRERDRVPTEPLRRHVQSQIEAARAVYARMAKEAE